jgi:hypothetical protein
MRAWDGGGGAPRASDKVPDRAKGMKWPAWV